MKFLFLIEIFSFPDPLLKNKHGNISFDLTFSSQCWRYRSSIFFSDFLLTFNLSSTLLFTKFYFPHGHQQTPESNSPFSVLDFLDLSPVFESFHPLSLEVPFCFQQSDSSPGLWLLHLFLPSF